MTMKKISIEECLADYKTRLISNKSFTENYAAHNKTASFYRVSYIEFNESNRLLRVSIVESFSTRRVLKYIQSNYVRTAIYSDWQAKTKVHKKSLKLTNEVLESLNHNEDNLISLLADQIVDRLPDKAEFHPSWYLANAIAYHINSLSKAKHVEWESQMEDLKAREKRLKSSEGNRRYELNNLLEKCTGASAKRAKASRRLKKAEGRSKSIPLIILTFGLYALFASEMNKRRIKIKEEQAIAFEKACHERVTSKQEELDRIQLEIGQIKQDRETLTNRLSKEEAELAKQREQLEKEVTPIKTEIAEEDLDAFVPLSVFAGTKHKKIVGCYVIRNRENGKVYVGQSKDVHKRIVIQHFNGTEVKNIIFAEDYYTSSFDDKSQLFEVRIIPCSTKDELDSTEKDLIELYDSFRNGYNKTSGNE